MRSPEDVDRLGGNGKIVEADETFWGNEKEKPEESRGWGHKNKIFSLVERGGHVRSFHVKRVTSNTLKPILEEQVDSGSYMMTDNMKSYSSLEEHFDKHDVVCHYKKEYVRGDIHTNTIEGFFSILKRGLSGIYQHVWSHHLKRYVAEFNFRYSNRKVSDAQHLNITLKGIEGKRLFYLSPTFA